MSEMNKYEIIAEKIRPLLDEFRYSHVYSVYKECVSLAELFSLDEETRDTLLTSALFHDISKPYDKNGGQEKLAEELGVTLSENDRQSLPTIHAITGGPLARKLFAGYVSDAVIECIRWHSTGKAGMTTDQKLLYLADYIEPTRRFDDCRLLRKFFYDGAERKEDIIAHLDRTLLTSLDITMKQLIEENRFIHPDALEARNFYLRAIK